MPEDYEPCDTCNTGLMKLECFDGLRRCEKCIAKFAAELSPATERGKVRGAAKRSKPTSPRSAELRFGDRDSDD